MRLTLSCRIKALEAGTWQRRDGTFVRVREMPDGYLINALLRTLLDREPRGITQPLAWEVKRRGLQQYAEREVERRTNSHAALPLHVQRKNRRARPRRADHAS